MLIYGPCQLSSPPIVPFANYTLWKHSFAKAAKLWV